MALLAMLPLLLYHCLQPSIPVQVPVHYTNGHADRFASQQWLRDVATLPVVLYVALTCIPQVHSTTFSLWRSSRQRQLRAVLVTAFSAIILAVLYRTVSIH